MFNESKRPINALCSYKNPRQQIKIVHGHVPAPRDIYSGSLLKASAAPPDNANATNDNNNNNNNNNVVYSAALLKKK